MAQKDGNKYDRDTHDDYLLCPRPSCRSRNAPPESEEFQPNCWNCGEHLGHQPVSAGDEYTIDVTDIHGSGAGVGHTEEGFVILVDGVLPEKRIVARVENVKENYAWGELVEVVADEIPDEDDEELAEPEDGDDAETESDEEEDEDEGERLGSRENWWG